MKRVKKLDEDTLLFWCRGCEDYLPFEEFRQNGSEFGYSTKCFTCEAKRKEAPYRNTNPARLSKEKIIWMVGWFRHSIVSSRICFNWSIFRIL